MSTPIISRELRQIVASVRRDKTTGYISLKHQKAGQNNQGLMQFVEGKLAHVSYADVKNKDALERIKELTNPELSFGQGLSPKYLQTLDARAQASAPVSGVVPTPKSPVATPETPAFSNQATAAATSVGRQSRELPANSVPYPEPHSAPQVLGDLTSPNTDPTAAMRAAAGAIPPTPTANAAFVFEDHTGAASVAMNNALTAEDASLGALGTPLANPLGDGVKHGEINGDNVRKQAVAQVQATGNSAQDSGHSSVDESATIDTARPTFGGVSGTNVNASTASRLANVSTVPLRQRISFKVISVLLGITLVSLTIFAFIDYSNKRRDLESRLANHSAQILEQLETHLAHPLWDVDTVIVDKSIQAEMNDEHVLAVRVLDVSRQTTFASWIRLEDGKIIEMTQAPEGPHIRLETSNIYSPATIDTVTGVLELWIDGTSVNVELRRFLVSELIRIAILAIILIVVAYVFIRQILINRVLRLTEAADAISTGKTDMTIDIQSGDEIGLLADALRRMQASLQFAMRRLRR